jgi:hypothetical protein
MMPDAAAIATALWIAGDLALYLPNAHEVEAARTWSMDEKNLNPRAQTIGNNIFGGETYHPRDYRPAMRVYLLPCSH